MYIPKLTLTVVGGVAVTVIGIEVPSGPPFSQVALYGVTILPPKLKRLLHQAKSIPTSVVDKLRLYVPAEPGAAKLLDPDVAP